MKTETLNREMRESSDESPEVWQEWILNAIRKIRSQKQRPSIQRICQAIGSHHKFHEDVVAEKLEQAVEAGAVLKVYNKGLHSYKSPSTLNKNKTININKDSDLSRLVTKAVRVLGECDGSTVKSIENFVQKANNLHITDDSDYKMIIKKSLKVALAKGMLLNDGKLYRLGPTPNATTPKKRRSANPNATPSPRKKRASNNGNNEKTAAADNDNSKELLPAPSTSSDAPVPSTSQQAADKVATEQTTASKITVINSCFSF